MSAVAKVVKVKAQAALVENIAENLAVYLEGDIGSLIEDKDELELLVVVEEVLSTWTNDILHEDALFASLEGGG